MGAPSAPVDHRPEVPADAKRPPPHPPETGRALPHHLLHRYGRPPPDPVLRPQPPGPPTRAHGPGTLLPPPPRAERTGSVAPSGQGHDRGERARDKTEAWGGVAGSKPGGSEGVRRRLATSRQAQSSGRRPAEANRSRASSGTRRAGKRPSDGKPPSVTPHSPRDATGGFAPCGLWLGGRQPWPAPRAKARAVGWGGAEHLPPTPTLGPNLEGTWRGGRAEEGHRRRRHRARGKGGGAPGRGWRGGREGEGEPPFPPDPHSARRPPPSGAAPHPLPPEMPPDPTARPGRAAFQTSFPPLPSHPAPLGWRRGSGAKQGEERPPRRSQNRPH
ncbi:basic salivary proline-rich protein 3-like [Cervus canadensis]|uniref:basic salivary proline-rich protein 3-like n=1 Tax=Cervus canadensis TaxID=1574408 RepID=UPI001CA33A77|nr:basic salivary proline-rich protein 3-like [Cervus canadensis]